MELSILNENDVFQLLAIEEMVYVTPWTEETFRRCFEVDYHVYGLVEEDRLCGYVIFSLQVGECHILNIAVHPDFQRQGLGEKLMNAALSQAKKQNASIAYLEVRRSNSGAIKLYMKLDFIQIGERKNYYPTDSGREDALLFAKDLTLC